jgi:4a-hydroxytetrahydrobiopterin dehydratase
MTAPTVIAFWRAVLGYQDRGPEDLIDPRGPALWFQDHPHDLRRAVLVYTAAFMPAR